MRYRGLPLLTHVKPQGFPLQVGDCVVETDSCASRPTYRIPYVCLKIQAMQALVSTSPHLSYVGILYGEGGV